MIDEVEMMENLFSFRQCRPALWCASKAVDGLYAGKRPQEEKARGLYRRSEAGIHPWRVKLSSATGSVKCYFPLVSKRWSTNARTRVSISVRAASEPLRSRS